MSRILHALVRACCAVCWVWIVAAPTLAQQPPDNTPLPTRTMTSTPHPKCPQFRACHLQALRVQQECEETECADEHAAVEAQCRSFRTIRQCIAARARLRACFWECWERTRDDRDACQQVREDCANNTPTPTPTPIPTVTAILTGG